MSLIRQYRTTHALTLQQFAEMIGVKRSAVWKYEHGIAPSVATAILIDEATKGAVPRWQLRPDVWDAPAPVAA